MLVVTDYDLSTSLTGLFGPSIVDWCQSQFIPVGEFSRRSENALPSEPALFDIRIPSSDDEATSAIANIYIGFCTIRHLLRENQLEIKSRGSLATLLAKILNYPDSEIYFAPYMMKLHISHSLFVHKLREIAFKREASMTEKERFLSFILGHLLYNGIMKYPGPILSDAVLCSYIATNCDEIESLRELFEPAIYCGPFSRSHHYYWKPKIDDIIDELADLIEDEEIESYGDYNRKALEAKLKRKLAPHSCTKSECDRVSGGFWCPFTEQTVCQRSDCSVATSSWIPSGASLCRVEKSFYDEWAPLLGA